MHDKAELINQTCHTKTFSQNMEIHKKKILLNTKKMALYFVHGTQTIVL